MSQRPVSSDSVITFDLVIPSLVVPNRKQLTRMIAHEIAKLIGINERILSDRLSDNKKQSTTAMGDGISLLHLPMSGLQNALTVFIKLKKPVDMTAPDNKPVDIVCVLMTPEREGPVYLRTMARLSRLLRNAAICERLRAAPDEKTIRMILDQSSTLLMAA
jgi:PTS system nitrogen regulatory IIA component